MATLKAKEKPQNAARQRLRDTICRRIKEVYPDNVIQTDYRKFQRENPTFPTLKMINETFGSWTKFVSALYGELQKTDDEIKKELELFLQSHGNHNLPLKEYLVMKEEYPTLPTKKWIIEHYGTWQRLLYTVFSPAKLNFLEGDDTAFVETIKTLSPNPLSMTQYDEIRGEDYRLPAGVTVIRRYQSWRGFLEHVYGVSRVDRAQEEAQLDMPAIRALLLAYSKTPLTQSEYLTLRQSHPESLPSSSRITREYKLWSQFINAVYEKPKSREKIRRTFSESEVIEMVRQYSPVPISYSEYMKMRAQSGNALPGSNWFYSRWKSWDDFMRSVYGEVSPRKTPSIEPLTTPLPVESQPMLSVLPSSVPVHESDEVVIFLREQFPTPLTQRQYDELRLLKPELPNSTQILKRYGSWALFLQRTYQLPLTEWTKQSFIEHIRQLAPLPIRLTDYKQLQQDHYNLPSAHWVAKQFGTWNQFLKEVY